MKLTNLCHNYISTILKNGDYAIDATVGNGYDTVYIANIVGEDGKVIGFDVQEQAIKNTLQRLQLENLSSRVLLLCRGHENIHTAIPQNYLGRIKVVVFNLGYLPGSDKRVITTPENTLVAFTGSLEVLSGGGSLVVMVYTGHTGGEEEWDAILNWSNLLDKNKYSFEFLSPCSPRKEVPKLFVIKKLESLNS